MSDGASQSVRCSAVSVSRRLDARASGFSLIELIVVVVLLSVIAGLVAPRIMSNDGRKAEATVNQVGNLLSTLALRNATTDESQRLSYDASTSSLTLYVRRSRSAKDGSASSPASWMTDPLAPPIMLENARIAQAAVDGVAADERGWSVDILPGQIRPSIELVVRVQTAAKTPGGTVKTTNGGQGWDLLLLPQATAPEVRLAGVGAGPQGASAANRSGLRAVDLDASGIGDRPW